MTEYVINYMQKQLELNKKLLLKFDANLRTSRAQLTLVKLMVTALEHDMKSMTTLYHDLMELRQLIGVLNPHLQKVDRGVIMVASTLGCRHFLIPGTSTAPSWLFYHGRQDAMYSPDEVLPENCPPVKNESQTSDVELPYVTT